MDDVLNLRQVAQYLKLSEVTVVRLAKQGVIPGVKLGKQWRFAREKIVNLIHEPAIIERMDARR
jgi:excisionase family DNA binding protein